MHTFVHFDTVVAMASYTLGLSILWSHNWPVGAYTCTVRAHENMNTHTFTVRLYWLPRIYQLLDSSTGTNYTPHHSACHKEMKSRQLASSVQYHSGELNQLGTAPRRSTHFKLAPHSLMEEIQWRITLLWKLNPSSKFLSLTFIMFSIVCVCVS